MAGPAGFLAARDCVHERRRGRLSSECGVNLVVPEVRYNSRREIRLQVLIKKLLAVRLRLPDLDYAYPAGGTWASGVGHEALRRTQQRHQLLQHRGISPLVEVRLFSNHEYRHRSTDVVNSLEGFFRSLVNRKGSSKICCFHFFKFLIGEKKISLAFSTY